MNETATPPVMPTPSFLKRGGTVLKMAGVALLILLLLIPLGMIASILRERLERRNAAVAEITASWGQPQQIVGPVLVVPYQYSFQTWRDRPAADGKIERVEVVETATANAYFLPAALSVEGKLTPQPLRRGIYRTTVYEAALSIAAEFARPNFASLKIDEADVLWEDARVTVAIPDLRGVKETLSLHWGGKPRPLAPGCRLRGFASGLTAAVDGLRESTGPTSLKLDVALRGSEGIHFTPVGATNTIILRSPWPDPSFQGAFLPTRRTVTEKGFEGVWEFSFYGRDYAQQWTDRDATSALTPQAADAARLGVNLHQGIDTYRKVERAIKYGGLFLVLVFAAFFLFEVLAALRIHPFQYTVVGAAMCLFYLGVLSLSEFISFGQAYLVSAGVTTLLIWFYCAAVLKSGVRTLIVVGLLTGIYGFLYVALQLQDYALLFGTGGLFVVLAIVIGVTRRLDW
jgi:inner membrane protein